MSMIMWILLGLGLGLIASKTVNASPSGLMILPIIRSRLLAVPTLMCKPRKDLWHR